MVTDDLAFLLTSPSTHMQPPYPGEKKKKKNRKGKKELRGFCQESRFLLPVLTAQIVLVPGLKYTFSFSYRFHFPQS